MDWGRFTAQLDQIVANLRDDESVDELVGRLGEAAAEALVHLVRLGVAPAEALSTVVGLAAAAAHEAAKFIEGGEQ